MTKYLIHCPNTVDIEYGSYRIFRDNNENFSHTYIGRPQDVINHACLMFADDNDDVGYIPGLAQYKVTIQKYVTIMDGWVYWGEIEKVD